MVLVQIAESSSAPSSSSGKRSFAIFLWWPEGPRGFGFGFVGQTEMPRTMKPQQRAASAKNGVPESVFSGPVPSGRSWNVWKSGSGFSISSSMSVSFLANFLITF